MAAAKTLAYYNAATITAIKSFVVQARGENEKKNVLDNGLSYERHKRTSLLDRGEHNYSSKVLIVRVTHF
jgi:hypothetical protein